MRRKLHLKTTYDPTSIIKETNQERVSRINSSRKLNTQVIPNKKKISRAQQKQKDHQEVN